MCFSNSSVLQTSVSFSLSLYNYIIIIIKLFFIMRMRPPPLSHHCSPQFPAGQSTLLWSLCSTKNKTSNLKMNTSYSGPHGPSCFTPDFTLALTNCFQYIMSHSILGKGLLRGRLLLVPFENGSTEAQEKNLLQNVSACNTTAGWKNHVLASPSLRRITEHIYLRLRLPVCILKEWK